jgi:hypothetical protein
VDDDHHPARLRSLARGSLREARTIAPDSMSGRLTIAAAAFALAFVVTLAMASHDPKPVPTTPPPAAAGVPAREVTGKPARLRAVADLPALRRSPAPTPAPATLVVAPATTHDPAPPSSATAEPTPVPTTAPPAVAPAPAPQRDDEPSFDSQDTFDSSG